MVNFSELLSGGDLRSIGKSDAVVKLILEKPKTFDELFECLYSEDPVIRMRSADAIEKISVVQPTLLKNYKTPLLQRISRIDQKEVQWHYAQIVPRLALTNSEAKECVDTLLNNVQSSKSNIVKVFSIQAIYDIAKLHTEIAPVINKLLIEFMDSEVPSIKSRVRKLMK